ncbi:DNA-(apurinic or apyrimidinic site) lyase [Zalaria obscura]|uniref:DNA-(Apurinic or apyrimidinic site) lyase n=1 Tax=Zalaria obscura TaxID=2024903 RepID=A0ACC3SD40_9PEZI
MPRRTARDPASEDSSELSSVPPEIESAAAISVEVESTPVTTPRKSRKRKVHETADPAANGTVNGHAKVTPVPDKTLVTQDNVQTETVTTTSRRGRRSKVTTETAVKVEESQILDQGNKASPKNNRKRKAAAVKQEEQEEQPSAEAQADAPPKRRRKAKVEVKEEATEVQFDEAGEPIVEKKVKRKRKTKEEKEAEAMPLAARTVGHKMFVGAHVSSAGGVHNAVTNSVHIGANAFALFLKSQRKWANPPLDDGHCSTFHDHCKTHDYQSRQHVLPHGSYLVNLAHTDAARTKQAYDAFLDDLHRCERLGIRLYNFHPGNSLDKERSVAIAHLAGNLNRAHKETESVVTVLENMAAGGNVLGSTFEDLRDIIALVEDKSRVGVCLDTCHAFAAGYDLRTAEALQETLAQFDRTVGMNYLRALHLNDSKAPFSSNRDLHANIGTGFLGLRAFHGIMNEGCFAGLPMVLETPIEVRDENGELVKDEKGKEKEDKGIWAREIKMLESFVGMDMDSEEFKTMEAALGKKGEPERRRVADQVERREEKRKEKAEKEKGKKKRGNKKSQDLEDESEVSALSSLESSDEGGRD